MQILNVESHTIGHKGSPCLVILEMLVCVCVCVCVCILNEILQSAIPTLLYDDGTRMRPVTVLPHWNSKSSVHMTRAPYLVVSVVPFMGFLQLL